MTFSASRFQKAMDILKIWWLDGFDQQKVNKQHALCDAEMNCWSLPYLLKYTYKEEYNYFWNGRVLPQHFCNYSSEYESGGRGWEHMHILIFTRVVQLPCEDELD